MVRVDLWCVAANSKDYGEGGSVVRCIKYRGEGGSVVRCSKDRGEVQWICGEVQQRLW